MPHLLWSTKSGAKRWDLLVIVSVKRSTWWTTLKTETDTDFLSDQGGSRGGKSKLTWSEFPSDLGAKIKEKSTLNKRCCNEGYEKRRFQITIWLGLNWEECGRAGHCDRRVKNKMRKYSNPNKNGVPMAQGNSQTQRFTTISLRTAHMSSLEKGSTINQVTSNTRIHAGVRSSEVTYV